MIFYCHFRHGNWAVVEEIYNCEVSVVENPEIAEVTGIIGNHLPGFSNNDVEGFYAYGRGLDLFPSNLEAIFPKIIAFVFAHNQFTSISSDDLAPWTNLRLLRVDDNKIGTVDGNLFKSNRKFEYLDFDSNLIENVGLNLLRDLNELAIASFENNPCISFSRDTPQGIEELIAKLLTQCPPLESIEDTTTITISTTKDTCSSRCSINEEVDNLELKFDLANQEIDELRLRLERLERIIELCQCAP